MADQPDTVTVESLQLHTYNGKEYQVGDVYEIPASLLDSVIVQGKAKAAAAKAAAPVKVEPMTTANTPALTPKS